ncbi:hypothetical protein Tco_0185426 [Tanacetum coccineum]
MEGDDLSLDFQVMGTYQQQEYYIFYLFCRGLLLLYGNSDTIMLREDSIGLLRYADRFIQRRKLQAGTSAYEEKKEKEVAMMEFKEMEFLTIDVDLLPEPKASIIRKRQEKIIAKYAQQ